MQLCRATFRYRHRRADPIALKLRLRELAATRVRYGYRRLHVLLRREGWKVNAKRVYRLYQLEGLSLRLKPRKKRVSRLRVVLPHSTHPNERWSLDFMSDTFMSDTLGCGRRIRVLTAVDHFSRVSPLIEVDVSLSARRVVEALERACQSVGYPQILCVDNGPEFTGRVLDQWAHWNKVKLHWQTDASATWWREKTDIILEYVKLVDAARDAGSTPGREAA